MSKRDRKRIQRVAPMASQYAPGGAMTFVPPGYAQSQYAQTFYGTTLKNAPATNQTLYSPGIPLPPQPGVDPLGRPIQWRYPFSYNTWQVDRTAGYPDIPSFEQLRRLAKMYDGITMAERYWLDMVPRLKLDIRIKKVFADAGAETRDYQEQISCFKTFWEKPDGRHDLHTWLGMMLREQSQIDELYLYKNRTRGKKLLGLWVVDGAQMKPLLDDWGMTPEAPDFAFQQYPWGIPGMQYSTDMMIHYQESPAAYSPYGFSRVERVIMRVNQALRKERKDLSNFTEGNIPQSFMEVPESTNWTPDQIDSYEQSWNALLAGNAQQQIRMKFLQPGMKYIPAEQYQLLTDFDLFLLRVTWGTYGVPPTEFGFTDDANRATGESQEDLVYRRTIGPLAMTYARLMTQSMSEDFPPEMQGEMFEAHFMGFEEVEDEQKKATSNTTYTGAGVLGLTDAAKLGNLPIDPEAPVIGRVLVTPTATLFLDDEEFMAAWREAQMSGFKLAANPPAPENDKEAPAQPGKSAKPGQQTDEKATMSRVVEVLERAEEAMRLLRARDVTPVEYVSQMGSCTCATCQDKHGRVMQRGDSIPPYHDGCDCKIVSEGEFNEQGAQADEQNEERGHADPERAARSLARAGTQYATEPVAAGGQDRAKAVSAEYRRWRERAIADAKAHRAQRPFVSTLIPDEEYTSIWDALRTSLVSSVDDVRAVFERAKERDASPKAEAASASASGGSPHQHKSGWKLRW